MIILFTGITLNSCKDNNDPLPEDKNYQYFVSNELNSQVTANEIKIKILYAQSEFPEISHFVPLVKNNVEVQKITYNTTFQDRNIKASGLVFLPMAAENFPVLSFQDGTNTQHSQAPSENLSLEMHFILESVASMGFIVVVPDYIGFGASSNLPHPYLHAQSTTQSILDMLRAMNEFTSKDQVVAKPTKDLFIFGYSQGGWATMLLQREIETRFDSEFHLKASSCASGPYSLEYMSNYIASTTTYPMPYFLAYLLNAYTFIGLITNPLSDFIKAPYAAIIPGLFDGTKSGTTINAALTTVMADFLTPDYMNQQTSASKFSVFNSVLVDNSVEPWQMTTPTRLYHGQNDELIPIGMSQEILLKLKAEGTTDANLQLIPVPNVGHTDGFLPVVISTILWFTEIK